MNALWAALALVVGFLVWRKVWCRTARDFRRDQLFDLRDELREYFLDRGLSQETEVYRALRDLINAHLRYMPALTVNRFLSMGIAMSKRPELLHELKADLDRRLASPDKDLAAYASDVRQRAIAISISYLGETSFLIALLLVIGLAWRLAMQALASLLAQLNGSGMAGMTRALRVAPIAASLFAMPAHLGWVKRNIDGASVEEYAWDASRSAPV